MPVEETSAAACVLRQDEVGLGEHTQSAEGNILHVPDGRPCEIEAGGKVGLTSGFI